MGGWVGDGTRADVLPSILSVYLCDPPLHLPSFPENPERLHAIKEQLILEGLLGRCVSFQVTPPQPSKGGWGTGRTYAWPAL